MPSNIAALGYLLAFVAGISFVFQQAVNSNLRAEIGSAWWAGSVSYFGGTAVMLLMAWLMRQPLPSMQMISRSQWLSWTGERGSSFASAAKNPAEGESPAAPPGDQNSATVHKQMGGP
jgi:uncharacterized membrane protein YdcZ (DUF606 family)